MVFTVSCVSSVPGACADTGDVLAQSATANAKT